ncbi:MAG TPA: YkvA family protein [Longimicrobiales bacterium]
MPGKAILRRRKSRRARLAVAALIAHIPSFLRLLYRLLRDRRISRLDKALLGATVAYVLTPADLIPDFLAFLGRVDDLYLLALVLNRLLLRAGPDLLFDHWDGSPRALEFLLDRLDQIGALVPAPVRLLLRGRAQTP